MLITGFGYSFFSFLYDNFIDPEFQNKGVHAVIFNEYYNIFTKKGIQTCYRTPELEDNYAIHQIWKHFSPEVYRRRKTFRKTL